MGSEHGRAEPSETCQLSRQRINLTTYDNLAKEHRSLFAATFSDPWFACLLFSALGSNAPVVVIWLPITNSRNPPSDRLTKSHLSTTRQLAPLGKIACTQATFLQQRLLPPPPKICSWLHLSVNSTASCLFKTNLQSLAIIRAKKRNSGCTSCSFQQNSQWIHCGILGPRSSLQSRMAGGVVQAEVPCSMS